MRILVLGTKMWKHESINLCMRVSFVFVFTHSIIDSACFIYCYYFIYLLFYLFIYLFYLFVCLFICLFTLLSVLFICSAVAQLSRGLWLAGCLAVWLAAQKRLVAGSMAGRRLTYRFFRRYPQMRHQDAPFSGRGSCRRLLIWNWSCQELGQLGLACKRISGPSGLEIFLCSRLWAVCWCDRLAVNLGVCSSWETLIVCWRRFLPKTIKRWNCNREQA